jgi:hypothetical protein
VGDRSQVTSITRCSLRGLTGHGRRARKRAVGAAGSFARTSLAAECVPRLHSAVRSVLVRRVQGMVLKPLWGVSLIVGSNPTPSAHLHELRIIGRLSYRAGEQRLKWPPGGTSGEYPFTVQPLRPACCPAPRCGDHQEHDPWPGCPPPEGEPRRGGSGRPGRSLPRRGRADLGACPPCMPQAADALPRLPACKAAGA